MASMTESQRIVLNWKAQLKQMGWPEESIAEIVKGLCEAGYRQCVDDIQARGARKEAIIAQAVSEVVN